MLLGYQILSEKLTKETKNAVVLLFVFSWFSAREYSLVQTTFENRKKF